MSSDTMYQTANPPCQPFARHPLRFAAILLCSGCSSGSIELGEVHGRVTLDGRPLADVVVTFTPETASKQRLPTSTGTTDADGNYRLTTDDGRPGAVVGPHRVIVEDLRPGDQGADHSREAQDDKPVAPQPRQSKSRVPERYRIAVQSPLQQVVKAGENVADLSLLK